MSVKLEKEKYFLKFLLDTSEKQQRVIIQNITKPQMRVIIEIIFNALKGNLILSENIKNKLKRFRNVIRKLVSKIVTFSARKQLLLKHLRQIIQLIKPCVLWLKN